MKKNLAFRLLCAVGGLLLLGGCRHASLSGQGTFRFVAPEAPKEKNPTSKGEATTANNTQWREAIPLKDLAVPKYPQAALVARAGWATVGLKITVGVDGKVSAIEPSMLTFSTPGSLAEEFREAAEAALAQWRFRPAELRYLENGRLPDGSLYARVVRTEKVEQTFDVAFTFTPDGKVQSPSVK